jgi:hypothetical protein
LQRDRQSRDKSADSSGLLLEPAYELELEGDEYQTDEDGNKIEIVDATAVRIAVHGQRRVALTETERRLAVLRMIQLDYRFREIASHIGTSPDKIRPVIEGLGYELIPRRQPDGRGMREATEIRKKVAV